MSSEENIDLLKRLVIAHADLQTALSAITFLNDEVDDGAKYSKIELRKIKCFETAFIISYGRAFTNSKGRYQNLPLKRIGVKISDNEKIMHRRIIDLRNKVYAHSDENFAHVRLDIHKRNTNEFTYHIPHLQFDEGLVFHDFRDRLEAMDLIRKIMHHLLTNINEFAQKNPGISLYLRPVQN
ncbi:hypothetical protein [Stappia sp. 28M-7]|uniref:hypothetical protein n=1 Tax=Stappia sp. 28M-7 TaxID=2762596 RepID=UPI00163BCDB0|nr:hypothetical protein [Stappia sp. 28M-7]MBC2857862.1 hypothetical protein [Stappia sp. 28M-7]